MTGSVIPRAIGLAVLLASACEPEQKYPEVFPDPRPADPVATPTHAMAHYQVAPGGTVSMIVPATEEKPAGDFAGLSGTLELDPLDLSHAKGAVEVDVGTLQMRGFADPEKNAQQTVEARNWLGLGEARHERDVRARSRARFELRRVVRTSHAAAHVAPRLAPSRKRPGRADGGTAESPEVREASIDVLGELQVNAVRVAATAQLRVRFHYSGAATPGAAPDRITVATRSPLRVNLDTHDIKPRDAAGVLLAGSLQLLGKKVGRDARVDVELTFERR